jgi:hypothetical protein
MPAKRKASMARIESSVTSVSWIPLDAMEGVRGLITDLGVGHWDLPPPDQLENLDELIAADAIRFANQLRAWIEVEGGHITRYGHLGNGRVGQSTLVAESRQIAFAAVALPDLRRDPQVDLTSVRFVQTTGGRTGVPLPRRVHHRPFVQLTPPTVWTTLALTIHADGSSHHEVVGASPFPRHWIYDHDGTLVAKIGLIDFTRWLREASGQHTPWGREDSAALVTAVESALERRLSHLLLEGGCHFEGSRLARRWWSRARLAGRSTSSWMGCWPSNSTARSYPMSDRAPSWGNSRHWSTTSCSSASCRRTCTTARGWPPRWPPSWGSIRCESRPSSSPRQFDPSVAVIVAEIPATRFRQVERQLRAAAGLVFSRRPGRDARAGRRTATVRAVTPCRVAVVPEGLLDRDVLAKLAKGRRGADLDGVSNPSSK